MATPDNYTIGSGIISAAEYDENTPAQSTDFVDLGNVPSLTISPAVETLEHKSSRTAEKEVDKEVVISTAYTIAFSLEEYSPENLAMFFQGEYDSGTKTISGLTNLKKEYVVKFTSDNSTGPNYTYTFHRVKLTPSGDAGLIGTEWGQLAMTGKGLSDRKHNEDSPYFTIEEAA